MRTRSVKSVRIRSFSGPYIPGMDMKRYGVSLLIQSECGKIRSRKIPYTNTFHAVIISKRRLNELIILSYNITTF